MTHDYIKLNYGFKIMTDNYDPTEKKLTDWFCNRSKFTQKVLTGFFVWGVFLVLPFLMVYICYSEELGIKKYFRELKSAYTVEFWEFRQEFKDHLEEFQKTNTKLHRVMK